MSIQIVPKFRRKQEMNMIVYQRLVNKKNSKRAELASALDTNNAEKVLRLVAEIQELDDMIEVVEAELEEE